MVLHHGSFVSNQRWATNFQARRTTPPDQSKLRSTATSAVASRTPTATPSPRRPTARPRCRRHQVAVGSVRGGVRGAARCRLDSVEDVNKAIVVAVYTCFGIWVMGGDEHVLTSFRVRMGLLIRAGTWPTLFHFMSVPFINYR